MPGADLHRPPFTEVAVLTDGGVYDNLGLERVWRRCRTILVSNGGRNTPELGSPTGRWAGQLLRTLNLVQQQAENSRKRILFGVHNLGQRNVAYWSIDAPIASYGLADALQMPVDAATKAANLRTRLNPLTPAEIDLLLRAGYAGADASLRVRGLAVNTPVASFDAISAVSGA
jgi:NTE family protein